MNETVVQFEQAHRQKDRGLFSLKNIAQRPDVPTAALGSGWWELDQIWKIYPGQFTIVTGIPGHGKSTFLLNLVCRLHREHSIRSLLYMPEDELYLRSKLRRIWGAEPGFDEFSSDECFVQSCIPEHYDDAAQDLAFVLNTAVAAIRGHQVGLILIDPWNELEHAKPNAMPMTEYIRMCLMYLKQFGRAYGVSIILVAHPTKAVAENGGRTPMLSDIEGSMSWYNKCDNGLIVVRDSEKNTARVISAKAKEFGAGKVGSCFFHVDPQTGIFTPMHGAADVG